MDRAVTAINLADEFGRTAKILGSRLSGRLSGHGMSMPRFNILVALMRHGPMRTSELTFHVGITQGTASALTEALVREGLVERRGDPNDRRATQLDVTDLGRERATAWLSDYENAATELFSALPQENWPAFLTALRTLSADQLRPDG